MAFVRVHKSAPFLSVHVTTDTFAKAFRHSASEFKQTILFMKMTSFDVRLHLSYTAIQKFGATTHFSHKLTLFGASKSMKKLFLE